MNPFNLSGGAFLLFFAAFILAINLGLRWWQRRVEAEWPMPRLDLSDPFKIAYLRGGSAEALKVAVFALVDRGLLSWDAKDQHLTAKPDANQLVRRDLEKAVLIHFKHAAPVEGLFKGMDYVVACQQYKKELADAKLLMPGGDRDGRFHRVVLAMSAIGAVAGVKLMLAVQRGKPNVFVLVVFALVGMAFAYAAMAAERTGLGQRFLRDQQTLFKRLKNRASLLTSGGANADAVIVAAVFGFSALPIGTFPYLSKMFPQKSNADSGSSCGMTDNYGSSSSDSSGSSGCGGGGGCGGCGS